MMKLSMLSAAMTIIAAMSANAMSTSIINTDIINIIDPTAVHVLGSGATDTDPVILNHPISSCPELIIRPAAGEQVRARALILVAPLLSHPQCRYFQSVAE